MRAVIIDDNIQFAKILSTRLNGTFEEEVIFTDAREALDFINKENFNIDYIFLDMKMPKYDGWDFLKDLSLLEFQRRKVNQIPIIVLTGYKGEIKNIEELGIKKVISKNDDYVKEINETVNGRVKT